MAQKLCFGDGDKQPQHVADLDQFPSDARRDDKLSVYCRKCAAARQRRWKHANPDKVRAAKRAYREKCKRRPA